MTGDINHSIHQTGILTNRHPINYGLGTKDLHYQILSLSVLPTLVTIVPISCYVSTARSLLQRLLSIQELPLPVCMDVLVLKLLAKMS